MFHVEHSKSGVSETVKIRGGTLC